MTSSTTVLLRHPSGARAVLDLLGARLLSWVPAAGPEQLYIHAEGAGPDCTEGLQGGVPLIFPQFAARGRGPFHGVAKDLPWQAGAAPTGGTAVLQRRIAPGAAWPHDAGLTLRVTLAPAHIALALTVTNLGGATLPFQAGLHTFLAAPAQASIEGLEHLPYVDHPGPEDRPSAPQGAALVARAPLDRIFPAAAEVTLVQPHGRLAIRQEGFAHTVIWRPADPATGAPAPFLCIEPAQLVDLHLAPDRSWTGTQTLTWPAAV